jgi:predicted amino acid-binding ACT domain protein
MIVLDYLKWTKNNMILVPPFHTGHLGLVPDTTVQVGLIAFPTGGDHCELIVTPYELSADKAYVHCTMKDQPGVVQRLLEAVSLLNINIDLQESSAIDRLNYHSVNLLIDWSSSQLRSRDSTRPQRQRYAAWQSHFPLGEERYVRLFESIVAHCGHLIVWDEESYPPRPQLFIRPLGGHQVKPHANAKVQRHDKLHSYHVTIPIPDEVLGTLHNRLGTQVDRDLPYVLLSETDERVLRVFFPRLQLVDSLVHLGFYHRDLPGALSTITHLLAEQQFNIITSLVRKTSKNHGVWETLLEYRGAERIPRERARECCEWVARMLCLQAERSRQNVNQFEFSVGLPLYPNKDASIRIPVQSASIFDAPSVASRDSTQILTQRINEARNALSGESDASKLLSTVKEAVEAALPTIFLSFPHSAKAHAELVVDRLHSSFKVLKYEPHGGESISEKVLAMISRCDYYIGIWHHDESAPMGNGKYGITPWMPYEYGIATALGKPKVIIHSEKLDERIWKRIDASIATPEYTDLAFKSETLDRIAEYCNANFVR